eukprot:TRINITY_DN9640_c0_g1_i1.p2 TRINITY_DN9640_c0_g1~~TRINITY_DN9640_c0_g1_i1.p2  ORF type:complete len:112 (-),score=33.74 TRINITY_DN9640_c0_g1_i1:49-384(-)
MNVVVCIWAGREIYRTIYYENEREKKIMYVVIAWFAGCWLLTLPLVVLIAHYLPDYSRQRIVTTVFYTLFSLELSLLFAIYSPFKFNTFFSALDPKQQVSFGTNKSQIFPM